MGATAAPVACRPVLRRVMAVADPAGPLNGNPVRARRMAEALAAKARVADAALEVAEARPLEVVGAAPEVLVRARPEMAFYRKYTESLLRKYARMSMDCGRTPSLLGRELFRGKVSSYKVKSFDDAVIFCVDVEKCLGRLSAEEREVLKRVGVQEYTLEEAMGLLGVGMSTVKRRYSAALDRLTGILLAGKLMQAVKSCQGGWSPK